jgi:hypothetical protein
MKKTTPKPMLNSPAKSSSVGMEFLQRVLARLRPRKFYKGVPHCSAVAAPAESSTDNEIVASCIGTTPS